MFVVFFVFLVLQGSVGFGREREREGGIQEEEEEEEEKEERGKRKEERDWELEKGGYTKGRRRRERGCRWTYMA